MHNPMTPPCGLENFTLIIIQFFFLMAVLFFLGFCSIHMGGRPYINNKIKEKRKQIKLKNSDIGEGSVAYVVKKLVGDIFVLDTPTCD